MRRQPCWHGGRHWFAYHGYVGSSSPVCTNGCGTPNPKYRPEDDVFPDSPPIDLREPKADES